MKTLLLVRTQLEFFEELEDERRESMQKTIKLTK